MTAEQRIQALERIVEHLAERVAALEATEEPRVGVLEAAHRAMVERLKAQRRTA